MAAFDWPDSPAANQQVVGPDGQLYEWDGVKWVGLGASGTWAPVVNLGVPANNYSPYEIDGGTY